MSLTPRHVALLTGLAVLGVLAVRHGSTLGRGVTNATGAFGLPVQRARVVATSPSTPANMAAAPGPATEALVGGSPLERFRRELARATALSDDDRGAADDVRCAVEALLGSVDCGALVRSLSPDEVATEFGCRALKQWAATDAQAATLWLATQAAPSPEETTAVASALAHAPESLAAISTLLANHPWREALLEQCSRALGASDPDRAVTLARQLPAGDRRSALLLSLADDHARQSPAAAAAWLAAEPNPTLRQELIATGAAAQSSTDPLGAVEWTLALAGPDDANNVALDRIVAVWSSYAPRRAAQFATSAGLAAHPLPASGRAD